MENSNTAASQFLAFDFGASSGRAILGEIKENKLTLKEIHRFSNEPVIFSKHLQWDILRLCHEVKQGILKCKNEGIHIRSIGVDTWGVDFGLLDEEGELMGNSYHYRDERTQGMMEKCFTKIPKEELFKETGLQFASYNTIYQLLSMAEKRDKKLYDAKTLLLMPDLINYMLTGEKVSEFTEVTTTQLYDYTKSCWKENILEKLNIPKHIFTGIIKPGMTVGSLKEDICRELNVPSIKVIAVGGHDTASAVAAVPAVGENHVFISSGTWSLLGIENDRPIINDKVYKYNFTNEGGVNDKVLLLKNIMGLWILQECKRDWEKQGKIIGFPELVSLGASEEGGKSFIDPDHELFYGPGNMPEKVKEFCRNTNQIIPESIGEIVRCVEESLALKYRWAIEKLEEITSKKIDTVHMVGGGIQDTLLCQLTANTTGKRVVAGPVEATAIGNIIVQAQASGIIKDVAHGKEIIRNSFEMVEYKAMDNEKYAVNYERFLKIISQNK
ncbi:rhamnulokinase [Clostridium estertheticum]|uniref:rhamnulokinase n=1 Tax=Clostridium estertheticum TaxID=238834 RepID=UPI0013E9245A|nr:rhamnulokinase [Clostridium estertheticum]MBZ9686040.1 rhamnulokinase [Clostridium estertheticum]